MPEEEQGVAEVMNGMIPGFDKDQSWSLKMLIREAVTEGVQAGIAAYQKSNCELHQRQTYELRTTVYGRDGKRGLDDRVLSLEAFEYRVARLTWLVIAQGVVLVGAILILVIQHFTAG